MALRPRQRLPHLSTGPPNRLLGARFLLLLRFLVSAFQLEEVFDLCSKKRIPRVSQLRLWEAFGAKGDGCGGLRSVGKQWTL